MKGRCFSGCSAVASHSAASAWNASTVMSPPVAPSSSTSAGFPPFRIAGTSPAAAAFSTGVEAQAGSAAASSRARSSTKKNWK